MSLFKISSPYSERGLRYGVTTDWLKKKTDTGKTNTFYRVDWGKVLSTIKRLLKQSYLTPNNRFERTELN